MDGEKQMMLHQPPPPLGAQGPGVLPPGFSATLALKVGLVSTQRQLLGFQQWTHGRGATSWGGMGGTRMCETCTFSKEEEEGRLGSGLALEGRADTHLLDLGYRSLLPTRKAGNLGKEGGSCWVPTKAREA